MHSHHLANFMQHMGLFYDQLDRSLGSKVSDSVKSLISNSTHSIVRLNWNILLSRIAFLPH